MKKIIIDKKDLLIEDIHKTIKAKFKEKFDGVTTKDGETYLMFFDESVKESDLIDWFIFVYWSCCFIMDNISAVFYSKIVF